MQLVRSAARILGALSLLCTLALLSPGVRAVRAGEETPQATTADAHPEKAPVCEAPSDAELREIPRALERQLMLMRHGDLARAKPTAGPDSRIVPLNTSGYNYQ
jgi:hypothetical protein